MSENKPGDPFGRGSVERVLRVLSALAELPGPVGARTLAEHVQLPDSTVYRLLGALREAGFATDLGRDVGFVPGPLCARLGDAANQTRLLEEIAVPVMQALCAETRETIGLMACIHRQMICLRTVESPQSLRCSVTEGAVLAMNRGASAKALLAHAGPAVQNFVLAAEAPERRAALLGEIAEIKRRGYAISDGEVDPGVWGVSVPLRAPSSAAAQQRHPGGQLLGAMTLMAPSSRAGGQQDSFIRLTIAAGQRIDAQIAAWRRPPDTPAFPRLLSTPPTAGTRP